MATIDVRSANDEVPLKEQASESEDESLPPAKKRRSEAATSLQSIEGNSEHATSMDDKRNKVQDGGEFTSVVASYYNNLQEIGLVERTKSKIFYLRNFNNWIKSMLIEEYLRKIRETQSYGYPIKVLDLCCGKGGDLLKWKKGNIRHLICADIAGTSVEQCKDRYQELKRKTAAGRDRQSVFETEFITADCTKIRLREKFQDPSIQLDLVSCQFSFHYSFESLPQAEQMLQNASECLKPGGFFIGTIPNACDIVYRRSKSDTGVFGNDIFEIKLESEGPYPLFGAKYDFYLEGVVNCPEFLVHYPTLVKLASRFGLKHIFRKSFQEYYELKKDHGRGLLELMQALETFPPHADVQLIAPDTNYRHAEDYIKNNNVGKVGTMSQSEWEAASLYEVFVFQKEKMNK